MRRKPEDERLGHPRQAADATAAVYRLPSVVDPDGTPTDYCRHPHRPADPAWHPIAQRWYEALFVSPQARLYEPSDVSQAELTAHLLSEQLNADKPSAMMIDTITRSAGNLLSTAGARLQLRVDTSPLASPGKTRGQLAVAELKTRFATGYNE